MSKALLLLNFPTLHYHSLEQAAMTYTVTSLNAGIYHKVVFLEIV